MSFMQAEEKSFPWIKDLVHKLKWTYGALWMLNTTESSRPLIGFDTDLRVAEWKDGWYNLDLTKSTRTAAANADMGRDESRIEALFYSSYKSCSFQRGFGYVGLVLLERQPIWLTGSQEVLDNAVHTQALFLKTARIQTVMCMPWNNHVLELGKFEQESKNEHVLYQIQRWMSFVMNLPLSTQPSSGGARVDSEDDSGGSREAMQMSPSIALPILMDGSNVNVHFGSPSSSDVLYKQQQRKSILGTSSLSISEHRETSSSSETRVPVQVQLPKRNMSFVRYPPAPPQSAEDAVPLCRTNQEVLFQRVPSVIGNEKPLEMGTSFAEDWGAEAGRSGVFQHMVVDSHPFISCSGLTIAGISSLLPADTFLQQHEHAHPRGGGGDTSVDQALLTSLPTTMPHARDIVGSSPLPMDLLQDSRANLFGVSSKHQSEWPALEPSKAQSVQMLQDEFTDEDRLQRLHPPDHALIQSGVESSSETMGDWVGQSSVTAPISHEHRHQYGHPTEHRQQQQQPQLTQQERSVQRQFEFAWVQNPIANNVQNMSTPRPALASLMTQQQHQPHQQLNDQSQLFRIAHAEEQQPQGPRWPISFTTSTAWNRWVGRKQAVALRYKGRDHSDASHAVLRVNQKILKKLLTEIVPTIAREQKAREQEAAGQIVESEISSHRAQMISYPTTFATRQESGGIQDPQARIHMLAERRRRVRENEHYAALRKLIPPTSRMDKATVLAETIQLVKRLRRRVRQLEKVNPDNSGTSNSPMVTSQDSQISTSPYSRGGPGSRTTAGPSEPEEGKPSGPNSVPASADPSQQDNEEIVDVDARACNETELRANIRTLHRPDTVIHILTCFKDLGLEVLSTNISIEKDWVQADFKLKINAVHSSRTPQFTEELQEAIRKAVSAIKSSTNSTLEGRSLTQGVIKSCKVTCNISRTDR